MKPSTFLKKHRWIRYSTNDGKGGYCIRGAAIECGKLQDLIDAWWKKSMVIGNPSGWNDNSCQSKAEAIRKLKSLGL